MLGRHSAEPFDWFMKASQKSKTPCSYWFRNLKEITLTLDPDFAQIFDTKYVFPGVEQLKIYCHDTEHISCA